MRFFGGPGSLNSTYALQRAKTRAMEMFSQLVDVGESNIITGAEPDGAFARFYTNYGIGSLTREMVMDWCQVILDAYMFRGAFSPLIYLGYTWPFHQAANPYGHGAFCNAVHRSCYFQNLSLFACGEVPEIGYDGMDVHNSDMSERRYIPRRSDGPCYFSTANPYSPNITITANDQQTWIQDFYAYQGNGLGIDIYKIFYMLRNTLDYRINPSIVRMLPLRKILSIFEQERVIAAIRAASNMGNLSNSVMAEFDDVVGLYYVNPAVKREHGVTLPQRITNGVKPEQGPPGFSTLDTPTLEANRMNQIRRWAQDIMAYMTIGKNPVSGTAMQIDFEEAIRQGVTWENITNDVNTEFDLGGFPAMTGVLNRLYKQQTSVIGNILNQPIENGEPIDHKPSGLIEPLKTEFNVVNGSINVKLWFVAEANGVFDPDNAIDGIILEIRTHANGTIETTTNNIVLGRYDTNWNIALSPTVPAGGKVIRGYQSYWSGYSNENISFTITVTLPDPNGARLNVTKEIRIE